MSNDNYVYRLAKAAGISEEQATKVVLALFQELIESVGEKSQTCINITPTSNCGTHIHIHTQVVINPPPPG